MTGLHQHPKHKIAYSVRHMRAYFNRTQTYQCHISPNFYINDLLLHALSYFFIFRSNLTRNNNVWSFIHMIYHDFLYLLSTFFHHNFLIWFFIFAKFPPMQNFSHCQILIYNRIIDSYLDLAAIKHIYLKKYAPINIILLVDYSNQDI